MATELPSLKAVQQQLADVGDKIAFVFVSLKNDQYDGKSSVFVRRTVSFERECEVLKGMGLSGTNHQWPNRTPEQIHAFFSTNPGDGIQFWVPTSILLDASGNIAKWTRGSGVDWRNHVDLLRNLAAQAR